MWKIIIGVAVLLIGVSYWYASYAGEKANEGVVIENNIRGNVESKVVLTEYADFECPACGEFYPVVSDVYAKYKDQMAFEFKQFPLSSIHRFAIPAAKAAEAAGQQDKFWEMHDKLFENQATWSKSPNPQAFFVKYAEEIGLDVALFKQHMRASLIADHVSSQFNEAREKGLTGTPTFFLNGERLEFKTVPEFIEKIESALGVGEVEVGAEAPASEVEFGIPGL